jgi:hypothetical protein
LVILVDLEEIIQIQVLFWISKNDKSLFTNKRSPNGIASGLLYI